MGDNQWSFSQMYFEDDVAEMNQNVPAEGPKTNGGQRSQRRPTAAFLGTFSNVGNCSTFANGKELLVASSEFF